MKIQTPLFLFTAALAAATLLLAACEQSPVQPEPCAARELDGRCWEYLGLEGRHVWTLAESPWGLFAGTSDHSEGFSDAGLFRLEQGSAEWERISHFDGFRATPLYVEPDVALPRLLVGLYQTDEATDHGFPPLLRSLDGGQTWTRSNEGWTDEFLTVRTLAAEHENGGRLFAGSDEGRLMISDDAGESWRQSQGFANLQIYPSPEGEGTVWAVDGTIFGYNVLKRSDDRGESWTDLRSSADLSTPVPYRLAYGGPRAGVLWGPADRGDSSGSWPVVLTSEDRGDTWTETETPSTWGRDVAVRGSEVIVAGAPEPWGSGPDSPLAVQSTRDGETWEVWQVPSEVRRAHILRVTSEGHLLIGTANGLWRVRDL